ncbi:MAG: LPP20 family lipoprotein [Treponema sp.]|jgi:hypothetical protein|nr:LPP20 family lipoprotein [Treponema sp.]
MPKIKAVPAVLAALLSACGSAPGEQKGTEPVWVSNPYGAYNRAVYIAAVGYGPGRDTAEKSALTNLASIFGQSITSETKTGYSYSRALEASGSLWSEKSDIAQAVKTSVAMDTLVGAEIKEAWKSPGGDYYALALLDKAKTSLIYAEMTEQNLRAIAELTNLGAEEKQSLLGFINYSRAAALADANRVFATVRNVISPGSAAGDSLADGNAHRAAAARIAEKIPIAVTVENDRQNRIKGALAGALGAAGFRTGGYDSRYVLKASLLLEEVSYLDNPYRWIRYTVDSALTDTVLGTVIFPYSVNGREGHQIILEAENRALRSAETAIKDGYLGEMKSRLIRDTKN